MTGGGIEQGQLDNLFTAALESAVGRIEKDGHFFPLVFELRANDTIQNVAVLEAGTIEGTQDVLKRLAELLRSRASDGKIKAAAIVHRSNGGMIEARLRAPNFSANIEVPFTVDASGLIRRTRRVELGELVAYPTVNDVFPGR